ncbi:MAG: hypothetical protein K6E91_00955 [Butyrivibrio sp.]|nr:hypothetical protein [Butyrivibrio sp.]
MKKPFAIKVITMATAAVMFAGTMTAGVAAPVIRVEAADASLTQTLRSAFDATFYANKYPDVKKAYGTNADALFNHFINNGMKEGRMINANFDPKAYIDAYSDIKAYCKGDYSKAYEHYYKSGKSEGRTLTTYDAINKKNAAEQAKAQAAAQAAAEKNKPAQVNRSVGIGHGLVVNLNEDQYRSCSVAVLCNDYGYAAYIGDDLYDTSGAYSDFGAYLYSTVSITNGRVHESVYSNYHYDKDDEDDALVMALLFSALFDDPDID